MADHAKGAILTLAITDALEVSPEPFDTNKWADIYRGLGDTWAGVAGWPTRGQGPDQDRLIEVLGFVILGGRELRLITALLAGLGPRSPRTGVSSTRTNIVFRLMTISSSTDIGHRFLDLGQPVHQHRWFEDWGVLLDQWSRARANSSQGSTPWTCPRDPDPWILGRVGDAGHADLLRH